ncbi:hypothetical protein chiPu_0021347 [Chiloscyllium punctatum]|uniref:Uncharacterized protein n=1 Tax=Chiloscyllium punctatum TaxID=137246 RepID=A0A401RQ81_CHIPU|nr:hypothetical protein [Chiloscyllium punctatum]
MLGVHIYPCHTRLKPSGVLPGSGHREAVLRDGLCLERTGRMRGAEVRAWGEFRSAPRSVGIPFSPRHSHRPTCSVFRDDGPVNNCARNGLLSQLAAAPTDEVRWRGVFNTSRALSRWCPPDIPGPGKLRGSALRRWGGLGAALVIFLKSN